MKPLLIAALLVAASTLSAQIPSSSPALDPDFVILQPKEEFTGRYANQSVGTVVHTVAPLNLVVPQGVVFLRNVDTLGYDGNNLWKTKPTGAFLQNSDFSLFNRAIFQLKGLREPSLLTTGVEKNIPILTSYRIAGTTALTFYFPDDNGNYTDTFYYEAYTPQSYTFAQEYSAFSKADLDRDTFDDLIAIETSKEGEGDSTYIGLWYDEDLVYRGDSIFNKPIIPASVSLKIPQRYNPVRNRGMYVGDFDKDGIIDFCFFGGKTDKSDQNGLAFVFGKSISNKWQIDTVEAVLDSSIQSFLFMDFLHEDGIADLIIGTDDTIYCFSGAKPNFLRHGFQLVDADFKIPAPGNIDPGNWGVPKIDFLDYGYHLWNAGDINGAGAHSLATSAAKYTGSLSAVPYFFVYSGGKAADEKVDAIYSQPAGIYNGFGNLDTVNTGTTPTGIILGDLGYNAGTVGKIWYFLGDKTIPHKPNPKWSGVRDEPAQVSLLITCSGMVSADMLKISIAGSGSESGTLILRDMLGREVAAGEVAYLGPGDREAHLQVRSVPPGCYLLTYVEGKRAATVKIMLTRSSYGETEKHFLPDRYVLPPFMPPASEWVESSYTSRLWEVLGLAAEQRKALKALKTAKAGMDPEEYAWRLHGILREDGDFTTK